MTTRIARNMKTGMFHLAVSSSASRCSAGNRGMPLAVASEAEIANADPKKFCKKCFLDGKPSNN